MLATTSRYSSNELRELGKVFATVFSGKYVSRGKKTFEDIIEYARRNGHSRVCVISSNGIDFAIVGELGNWKWIDTRIVVKKSKIMLKGLEGCREIEGKDNKTVSELFGFEGNEQAEENMFCEDSVIRFPFNNPLLELEVSYEGQVQHND